MLFGVVLSFQANLLCRFLIFIYNVIELSPHRKKIGGKIYLGLAIKKKVDWKRIRCWGKLIV
jgi:hypothetical protein